MFLSDCSSLSLCDMKRVTKQKRRSEEEGKVRKERRGRDLQQDNKAERESEKHKKIQQLHDFMMRHYKQTLSRLSAFLPQVVKLFVS